MDSLKDIRDDAAYVLAYPNHFSGETTIQAQNVVQLIDHIEAQERRIEELRVALTFYADRDVYGWGLDSPVEVDEGERARKALGRA